MDGFKGHDKSFRPNHGFVLAPNTSVFQPLDGPAMKAHYKSKLLGKIVSVASDYTELQALEAQMPDCRMC